MESLPSQTKSEKIDLLASALSKAQSQMKGALKDSVNPFFKSKYADLASVWDACREPLSVNGLAITQTTDITQHGTILITTLLHSSGQWISGSYPILPNKDDAQSMGSATTYARRYALMAMVGVSPEEDDVEAASGRNIEKKATVEKLVTKPNHNGSKIDSFARGTAQNTFPIEDQAPAFDNSMAGYITPKQKKELWDAAKECKLSPPELKALLETEFKITVGDPKVGEVTNIEAILYEPIMASIRRKVK